jgi:Tol biopolymer transport system component
VVFTADKDLNNRFDRYRARLDGTEVIRLNGPLAPGGNVGSFAISPDRTEVAYLADQDTFGTRELYVVRLDGSGNVRVSGPVTGTGTGLPGLTFTWSPDSAYIAYFSPQRSTTFELFTARPDFSLP